MRARSRSLWHAIAAVIAVTALAVIGLPAVAFAQSDTMTVSPASGPPGQKVTLNGEGFVAYTGSEIEIDISIDYGNGNWDLLVAGAAYPVPDANGNFAVSVTIPSNAPPGDLLVISSVSEPEADAFFTVTAPVVTVASVATWGFFLQNNDTSYKAAEHATSNFTPGEQIEYVPYVKNAGSSTVTETFLFSVTGPSGSQVYSWSGSVPVAPGTNGYILPSDIPNASPSGTYTITVTVSLNGSSASNKTTFAVSGTSRTLGTGLITSNPYPFGHTSSTGQCTYGADQIFDSYTSELYYPNGEYLPNFGNAYQWATAATSAGWTVTAVSSAPQLNSIAVFPANYISGEPNGHVAWVTNITKVTGGYNVTVAEMNGTAGPGYFDYYTYTPSQDKNARYILATDTSSQTWAQMAASAGSHATTVARTLA
jgi:surface antigen